jgi:hypothetical protein
MRQIDKEPIMSDNLFSAVLTFSLLAAGTVAVGSEMLAPQHKTTQAAATLPAVTVIGKRIAAADAVILPTVTVTGCRHPDTEVAVDDSAGQRRL